MFLEVGKMGYDPNQYNSSNDFYAQQQHADLEQLSATIANEKYQDRIMQLRIEIAKAPNVAVRSELQRILYEEKQKHRNRIILSFVFLVIALIAVSFLALYFHSASSASGSGQPGQVTPAVTSESSSNSDANSVEETSYDSEDDAETSQYEEDTDPSAATVSNEDYIDHGVVKTTKNYPSNTSLRNNNTSSSGITGHWQSGDATTFDFNDDGTYSSTTNGKSTSGTWKIVYRSGNILYILFTDRSGHTVVEPFALDNGNLIETNLKIKWSQVN